MIFLRVITTSLISDPRKNANYFPSGDYTGDVKSDVAFWQPSTGEWFVLRSENLSYYSVPFGIAPDVPAPGDYDGDGKYDTTVFRPASGSWFIQRSTAGFISVQFGNGTDRPIANAFVY